MRLDCAAIIILSLNDKVKVLVPSAAVVNLHGHVNTSVLLKNCSIKIFVVLCKKISSSKHKSTVEKCNSIHL